METILQHFRQDEQPFIEMAIGWIREVENTYSPKLTDFLDPRQRHIVETIARGAGMDFQPYGAFSEAERMRTLIFPDYFVPETSDYLVSVFQVKYASKFISLTHKDVLGSIMSLGIDRSKFGDIRLVESEVQFAVANELQDYLRANFTSVGKAKVTIEEVATPNQWIVNDETWKEELHIISSMRLDTVVSTLLNVSRQKAATFIHGEKVRVNWTTREQPAFEVQEHDLLSIRGAGRFKILAIEGKTRKEKNRVLIGKLE